jgi:hypothetical protein
MTSSGEISATTLARSEARMHDMFKAIDGVLRTHREVGAYNQTI